MREYTIVIEQGTSNYSAYVLDFDGCVATGRTVDEVTDNLRRAIESHFTVLEESDQPIPPPLGIVGAVKIAV